MVLTARRVNVPVLQFLGCSCAHFYNLNFKEKIDARQGMVSVYGYGIRTHFSNCHCLPPVGTEAHTGPYFLPTKSFLRYLLNELRI